jgi:hypothetical protein
MKRWIFLVVALLVVATVLPASAAPTGLSGPHWEVHLIGSKNGTSGDLSNGHSIMIPLKNATGPNEIVCEDEEVVWVDDLAPTFQAQEPAGAKLYWQLGDSFKILDRDATDGEAGIQIPWIAEGSDVMGVDVWVRVHGKPSTCIDIDAWAFDGDYYFWAGSVDLNRKTGRATWTKVNFLFDVNYCDVVGGACVAGTQQELSVFNNVFESYFWSLLNDGTRNVEIRLYPVTAP